MVSSLVMLAISLVMVASSLIYVRHYVGHLVYLHVSHHVHLHVGHHVHLHFGNHVSHHVGHRNVVSTLREGSETLRFLTVRIQP